MKKSLVIFLTVGLFFILKFSSFAQANINNPLDIKIYFSEQNPETKIFKVKVEIDSKITSNRNTIKWTFPEGIRTKSGLNEIEGFYCKITEGSNTYCLRDITKPKAEDDFFEFELDLIPYKSIDDIIVFTIQSYIDGAEKSYSVTQIANVKINSELELEPVTNSYSQLQDIINIKQLSTKLLFIMFVSFIGLIIIRRAYLYVNPQIKSELPHNSKILDAYQTLAKTETDVSAKKN